MSSASTHICIVPSRYNFAYSSGSSMASAFNEQTDPGVVYKSFSASQQSIRSIPALVYTSMLLRCGLYSANIVLIVSNLLIVQSIICCKNQKHFNQFTMSLLFCVILFYIIFLPLYLPLSEFVNTGGTI